MAKRLNSGNDNEQKPLLIILAMYYSE